MAARCRAAPPSPSSTSRNAYVLVGRERTLTRGKLREAVLAIKVERKLEKREILERYLNTIYFGRGAYGVEAASRIKFGQGRGRRRATRGGVPRRADPSAPVRRRAPRSRNAKKPSRRQHRSLQGDAPRRLHLAGGPGRGRGASRSTPTHTNQKKDEPRVVGESKRAPTTSSSTCGGSSPWPVRRRRGQHRWAAGQDDAGPPRPEARLLRRGVRLPRAGGVSRPARSSPSMTTGRHQGHGRRARTSTSRRSTSPSGATAAGRGRHAGSTFKPFLLAAAVRRGLHGRVGLRRSVQDRAPEGQRREGLGTSRNYENEDYGSTST